MKKSRFTEEQIIGFLRQAETGLPVKELCRQGGFSDALDTYIRWYNQARIKISLGSRSPIEHRRSLGLSA